MFISPPGGPTQDQYFYPPGAFGGAFPEGVIGQPGVGERQSRLNLVGVYSGFQKHTLRLGSGYYYGDLYNTHDFMNTDAVTGVALPPGTGLVDYGDTPYVFNPENVRKSWNWFLQDVWAFASDWELTTGVRYDHYSDFGATVNPRLALVWRINPAVTSKFLYARAFRTPTLNQLTATNNVMIASNPQLQPQTIDTGEIALNYHATDTLDLMTNLFIYKIGDAIRYRQSPERLYGNSIPFVPQNLGSQTGHGLELVAKWVPKASFNLMGNYAYQTATDENDHDPGYAPNHHFYLRTDWQFWPYWYWNTQVNWVGERPRPSDDTRPPLEGYATVDLTLRHKYLKDHWDFALSARNLFDADVREPSPGAGTTGIIGLPNDLPQAGRSIWLEMKYHF